MKGQKYAFLSILLLASSMSGKCCFCEMEDFFDNNDFFRPTSLERQIKQMRGELDKLEALKKKLGTDTTLITFNKNGVETGKEDVRILITLSDTIHKQLPKKDSNLELNMEIRDDNSIQISLPEGIKIGASIQNKHFLNIFAIQEQETISDKEESSYHSKHYSSSIVAGEHLPYSVNLEDTTVTYDEKTKVLTIVIPRVAEKTKKITVTSTPVKTSKEAVPEAKEK